MVKAALLNYCTNDGLSFVDGKEIDYHLKTKTNCLLFWKNISVSELIMNVLNKNNFPWLQECYPWPVEADDSFTTIQKTEGCLAKHNYGESYEII